MEDVNLNNFCNFSIKIFGLNILKGLTSQIRRQTSKVRHQKRFLQCLLCRYSFSGSRVTAANLISISANTG